MGVGETKLLAALLAAACAGQVSAQRGPPVVCFVVSNATCAAGDLVDARLGHAERLLDMGRLAASQQASIEAMRLLNRRVLELGEAGGIEWTQKETE